MAELNDLLDKYERDIEKLVKDASFDLSGRVFIGTPVDTGRARAGWSWTELPNIDRPFSYVNNVIYINALEYGHSDQAPQGFVRINVINWNLIVQSYL